MPSYGLLDTGFVPKPLDQSISDLEAGWIAIFGENVDLADPSSADSQIIGLVAGMAVEPWDAAADVATVLDPNNSAGALLSALMKLTGLNRRTQSNTVVVAEVVGVAPNVLQAGAIAETSDTGDRFVLQADVVFTGGSDSATFVAEDPGPVQCAAGTLTVITTPETGWTSVTNAAAAQSIGALREEDGEARIRRNQSAEIGSADSYSALLSGVRVVDGVTDVKLLVNETGAPDPLGLPAKSFRVVVEGGADDELARAIWNNHPIGIEDTGTSSGNATDSEGTVHAMNFSRPVTVDIWIDVTLVIDSAIFPSGGDELMKQAIVDYAAGQLLGPDGEPISDGFLIGENVPTSRIYQPINSIPGHSVTLLEVDTHTSPDVTTDIEITDLEKAAFAVARITVT